MCINFDHSLNLHSREGPSAAISHIFASAKPQSILDVGCGTGTWLKAAADFGIADYFGVDGAEISREDLLISPARFRRQDLTKDWKLGRRFEAVLCLEVAEHLEEMHAGGLVDTLVEHGDEIIFSAACPGQPGQGHINCQWPIYWQNLFNNRGFACEDVLRWEVWDNSSIEPWYRQNLFLARKQPNIAGHEPRIRSVVHPGMLMYIEDASRGIAPLVTPTQDNVRRIEQGSMPISWYLLIAMRGLFAKAERVLNNK